MNELIFANKLVDPFDTFHNKPIVEVKSFLFPWVAVGDSSR